MLSGSEVRELQPLKFEATQAREKLAMAPPSIRGGKFVDASTASLENKSEIKLADPKRGEPYTISEGPVRTKPCNDTDEPTFTKSTAEMTYPSVASRTLTARSQGERSLATVQTSSRMRSPAPNWQIHGVRGRKLTMRGPWRTKPHNEIDEPRHTRSSVEIMTAKS